MATNRPIPTLRLKIFRGDELLSERELREPSVSIGRAENAVVRVDDETLGDLHVVLNVEDDGSVQLLDLGTEVGTQHNGQSVSNATVASGDVITIGAVRVEVGIVPAEGTTPTIDVRPAESATPAEAATPSTAAHDGQPGLPAEDAPTEDVLELVRRSGTGSSTLGLDLKAPKVLEVNQIWHDMLIDSKHFRAGGEVTIGDAVGFRWSLIGIQLGWVPSSVAGILRASPPIWSDVRSDWRNDFYASDEALPSGEEFKLFVSEGNRYVARVSTKWSAFADVGDQRMSMDDLLASGKAKKSGEVYEIPVTEDLRLFVDVGHVVFVASLVAPGARVVTAFTDGMDYPFASLLALCLFLGGLFGFVVMTSPKPPENDMLAVEDRFVELLLEKPEPEEKKEDKGPEDANPDAGEGAKAKGEEGKVGKKDAKMEKAKGNKRDFNDAARDREIAENAGVLGAMDDAGGVAGVFGSGGLDANLAGGIGGLIGAKGVQIGSGGLGSRGGGLGGGGTADGLGGLGTKGTGSGRSGYGSGGGSFGAKGGGGGPSAASGDPIIMGALDRSLIDAVIKRKMQAIKYCYQRELQKDPALTGKVVIKFTIAKDGTVSQAAAKENSTGSKAVDACVTGVFYKMQFPEPKGGGIVIVSYPFIFSPG